jgi:hypothetical protein
MIFFIFLVNFFSTFLQTIRMSEIFVGNNSHTSCLNMARYCHNFSNLMEALNFAKEKNGEINIHLLDEVYYMSQEGSSEIPYIPSNNFSFVRIVISSNSSLNFYGASNRNGTPLSSCLLFKDFPLIFELVNGTLAFNDIEFIFENNDSDYKKDSFIIFSGSSSHKTLILMRSIFRINAAPNQFDKNPSVEAIILIGGEKFNLFFINLSINFENSSVFKTFIYVKKPNDVDPKKIVGTIKFNYSIFSSSVRNFMLESYFYNVIIDFDTCVYERNLFFFGIIAENSDVLFKNSLFKFNYPILMNASFLTITFSNLTILNCTLHGNNFSNGDVNWDLKFGDVIKMNKINLNTFSVQNFRFMEVIIKSNLIRFKKFI